jgi:hypothetical protein
MMSPALARSRSFADASEPQPASPIELCDRVLTLAREMERAGLRTTAARLVGVAESMPLRPLWRPAARW